MTTMTKKNAKRTDVHAPSKIVPADYTLVFSYSLPTTQGGEHIPGCGINCELDRRIVHPRTGVILVEGKHDESGRCCIVALNHVSKVKWSDNGGTGKCTVCGSCFVYGDVWKHEPTGEHINLGWICAGKHALLADRTPFEMARHRQEQARITTLSRIANEAERDAWLDKTPGIREAFKLAMEQRTLLEDPLNPGKPLPFAVATLLDMQEKFIKFRSLTEKQVALALKLAEEIRNPRTPLPTEKQIPAPEGKRLTVVGTIVSIKTHESAFGVQTRMTVKVQTPEGVWLAWGSYPKALWDCWTEDGRVDESKQGKKGDVVSFVADLTQGREPHFTLFKRPTQAKLVKKGEAK